MILKISQVKNISLFSCFFKNHIISLLPFLEIVHINTNNEKEIKF